jgi:hypothetical protein
MRGGLEREGARKLLLALRGGVAQVVRAWDS